MITLRPDQEDVRAKLRVSLRQYQSVLAFAPTGFGKTVLASALIQLIAGAGKKVIFGVHRDALIKQTANTFNEFGLAYSHIAAGYRHNIYRKVNIASIPTLQNRLGKYPADYLFIDEAHLSASSGWSKTVEHYKRAGTKIIGMTGSPERLDGKPLGAIWDTMVLGPSTGWLIENGFLSKYRAFAPAGVDLSGVRSRGGDYVSSDIDEVMAGKAVMAGAVRHWRKFAGGLRTIAFAPSIARSEQLAAEFRANGINAISLDGTTDKASRVQAFKDFADRKVEVLVNVRLFTEGFDLSAQVGRDVVIECVLDYAPTQSLALHLQKHGRGLRRDTKPHVLLDLVGGFARLGLPDDEREWSLDGAVKTKRSSADQEEMVRTCPECFASHQPRPSCPECGHVYEVKTRKIEEVEGDLEEVDVEALRKRRVVEQVRAETLDDLVKLATARGYKSPQKWAAHVFSAREAKQKQRMAG
jgi:superfamily II DNA or RNA helicase